MISSIITIIRKGGINLEKLALSVSQAAEVLGIGRSLCYRLVKSNRIPSVKLGERFIIPKEALEKFISNEVNKNINQ